MPASGVGNPVVPIRESLNYPLISQAAAAAFTAARLLHFRLRRRFPLLFLYLIISATLSLVFSVLSIRTHAYYWTYIVSQPLGWCAAALAVREMFALIFRDYPGLQTAGRWSLYLALGVSVAVSLLIAQFPTGGARSSVALRYVLIFDRSIGFTLTVTIVILMAFLSRYPLNLDRNTYVASGFFSAIFLAMGAVKLADSVSTHLYLIYADYAEVAFAAICFVGWGVMLRFSEALAPVRAAVNKPREAELLQQLEAMNQILSRSVRR